MMEELIKKGHQGQTRNGGKTPYTVHLYGVRDILESVIDGGKEITDDELILDLRNAALGHDLLEDTDAPKEVILASSSEKALSLIEEVTNPDDDAHTERYMEQLGRASEAGRLVKYADLIDNTLSVAYGFHDLGRDWVEDFYLPIMERTTRVLAETKFEDYPHTAEYARQLLAMATKLLQGRLEYIF